MQTTKAKLYKSYSRKLKSFHTAKEKNQQTEKHPTEREKIFANDISDKGLVAKIHKVFLQVNSEHVSNLT
jgi:hypothetical protein